MPSFARFYQETSPTKFFDSDIWVQFKYLLSVAFGSLVFGWIGCSTLCPSSILQYVLIMLVAIGLTLIVDLGD